MKRAALIVAVNAALIFSVLVVFEVGMRIFAPPWLRWRMEKLSASELNSNAEWKFETLDGQFLRFVPGSSLDVITGEYQHHAEIGPLGTRRVVPEQGAKDSLAFVGDSFVFGIGVKDGETFVSQLQATLPVRLINLGIPGLSLDRELGVVAARHVELGRPRHYVFCFFVGNDFEDLLTAHGRLDQAAPSAPSFWVRLNDWVSHSALHRSYLIQAVRQPAISRFRRRTQGGIDPVFKILNRADAAYQERVRTRLGQEIDRLLGMAKKLDFRFLVVLIPDRLQLSDELRQIQAQYYDIDATQLDPTLPNRILREKLAEREVEMIDPTAQLSADLYFRFDNHLNPAGHRKMAEILRSPVQAFLRR